MELLKIIPKVGVIILLASSCIERANIDTNEKTCDSLYSIRFVRTKKNGAENILVEVNEEEIDSIIGTKFYLNPIDLELFNQKLNNFGSGPDYIEIYLSGEHILSVNARAPSSSFTDNYYPNSLSLKTFRSQNGSVLDGTHFEIIADSTFRLKSCE